MKIISNIFYGVFITLLLGVAFLFLVPLLPIENNISMKIVESGSMEPKIMTGSLVVVTPASSYEVGDVITFESASSKIPTTHRIVSIAEGNGGKLFTTKGDANEEADTDAVLESKILGKVHVSVPYAGFIFDFARQPLGFGFLIVLPALMIILGEIEKIWREIRRNKKDKSGGTPAVAREVVVEPEVEVREIVRMIEIGRPILSYETITRVRHLSVRSLSNNNHRGLPFGEIAISMFAVVTSVCFASLGFIGSTVSYFNDIESSVLNTLAAQELDFTLLADDDTYSFIGNELDDEDGALIAIATPTQGSTDVKYDVAANLIGESTLFCDSIQVNAGLPLEYIGPLINLGGNNIVFDGPWVLSLSLPTEFGPFELGETCTIEIIYTAWNINGETGEGYSDEERVTLVFTAPVTPEAPLVEPLLFFSPESFVGESVEEEIPEETELVEEPDAEEIPEIILEEPKVEDAETQEPEDVEDEIAEEEEQEEVSEVEESQEDEPVE